MAKPISKEEVCQQSERYFASLEDPAAAHFGAMITFIAQHTGCNRKEIQKPFGGGWATFQHNYKLPEGKIKPSAAKKYAEALGASEALRTQFDSFARVPPSFSMEQIRGEVMAYLVETAEKKPPISPRFDAMIEHVQDKTGASLNQLAPYFSNSWAAFHHHYSQEDGKLPGAVIRKMAKKLSINSRSLRHLSSDLSIKDARKNAAVLIDLYVREKELTVTPMKAHELLARICDGMQPINYNAIAEILGMPRQMLVRYLGDKLESFSPELTAILSTLSPTFQTAIADYEKEAASERPVHALKPIAQKNNIPVVQTYLVDVLTREPRPINFSQLLLAFSKKDSRYIIRANMADALGVDASTIEFHRQNPLLTLSKENAGRIAKHVSADDIILQRELAALLEPYTRPPTIVETIKAKRGRNNETERF